MEILSDIQKRILNCKKDKKPFLKGFMRCAGLPQKQGVVTTPKELKERLKIGDQFFEEILKRGLKAYLLSKGWKLKRIHDLEELLDEAIKYNSKFEIYRKACQKVTGYYLDVDI